MVIEADCSARHVVIAGRLGEAIAVARSVARHVRAIRGVGLIELASYLDSVGSFGWTPTQGVAPRLNPEDAFGDPILRSKQQATSLLGLPVESSLVPHISFEDVANALREGAYVELIFKPAGESKFHMVNVAGFVDASGARSLIIHDGATPTFNDIYDVNVAHDPKSNIDYLAIENVVFEGKKYSYGQVLAGLVERYVPGADSGISLPDAGTPDGSGGEGGQTLPDASSDGAGGGQGGNGGMGGSGGDASSEDANAGGTGGSDDASAGGAAGSDDATSGGMGGSSGAAGADAGAGGDAAADATANAVLAVAPGELSFTHLYGTSTCPQPVGSLEITNTGAGVLNWHIDSTFPAWLSSSVISGTGDSTVALSFTCSGWSPLMSTAIDVTAEDGNGNPAQNSPTTIWITGEVVQ